MQRGNCTSVKARHYAEQFIAQQDSVNSRNGRNSVGDSQWYILSTAHHMLTPGAVIAPYNLTLNIMPIEERREWAAQVYRQLRHVTDSSQHRLVFLAGQRYREPLSTILEEAGYSIEVPMLSLGIGKQLAWLDKNSY